MIVLRRLLIPPLLVVFVVFIFPLILLVYTRAVLLDSEFYTKNYTDMNISDRVYTNILPILIDETIPGQLKGENYDIKDDVYRILTNILDLIWKNFLSSSSKIVWTIVNVSFCSVFCVVGNL